MYWTGGLQDEQYSELYNIIVHHEHLLTITEHLVQCSEHMVSIIEHLVPRNHKGLVPNGSTELDNKF